MKTLLFFLLISLYSCSQLSEGSEEVDQRATNSDSRPDIDLVGGMRVTLEVSTPEFVKSQVKNQNDIAFTSPFEKALKTYSNNSSLDFIDLFHAEFKIYNGGLPLCVIIQGDGIEIGTSDDAVIAHLRDLITKSMDGIENVMSNRINEFGVAQPNIQKDAKNNRLYIEIPGFHDEKIVAKKLQSTANLEFFETYLFDQIQTSWDQASALSKRDEGLEEDTLSLSFDETETAQSGLTSLIHYTGPGNVGFAKNNQDKARVDVLLNRSDIKAQFESQVRFMWGVEKEYIDQARKNKGWFLYACKVPDNGKAKVNGSHIAKASQGYDEMSGAVTVDLSMTEEGMGQWARMTSENINRLFAITMDNVVYSAPVVRGAIVNGKTQISGNFTMSEAYDLARLLNGGALPAHCMIKELVKVAPPVKTIVESPN